ncbi:MAG: SirB2 family protein [Pseudomonadota bacterium]
MYLTVKLIHQTTAVLTISGFMLRGWWMIRESPLLQHRLTRTLPHINDTVFLLTGLTLAAMLHQYPLSHDWLTAKVFGLLAYILLGSLALKRARRKNVRVLCLVLALLTFAWVVSVALTRSTFGFFAFLVG